jgi:plasmid stabilization system protein ParE
VAALRLSAAALDDLERLGDFLLEAAPDDALRLHRQILDGLQILEGHPLIGRPVAGELRELVLSQGKSGYLALYRYDAAASVVRILRVRHQREAGYRG